MSKLLSSNNKVILLEVKSYFLGMLLHLTDLLTNQRNEDRDTAEVRAVTLGRIAGVGLAMHQVFGGAVEQLGYAEHRGVKEAGVRTYEVAMKHLKNLEARHERSLN